MIRFKQTIKYLLYFYRYLTTYKKYLELLNNKADQEVNAFLKETHNITAFKSVRYFLYIPSVIPCSISATHMILFIYPLCNFLSFPISNRLLMPLYGPLHEKTCLWGFANNKGADQPVHPHSLISTFVICLLESIISKLAKSKISLSR